MSISYDGLSGLLVRSVSQVIKSVQSDRPYNQDIQSDQSVRSISHLRAVYELSQQVHLVRSVNQVSQSGHYV